MRDLGKSLLGFRQRNRKDRTKKKTVGRDRLAQEMLVEQKKVEWDFSGGAVVRNLPANAGDTGSSPGPGRSHMLQSK